MSAEDAKLPKRSLALLLAAILSGGIGHFSLGLRRRALFWLGVQAGSVLLLAMTTVAFDGSVVAYGGVLVFAVLARLGQLLDLAFLKRDRFKKTPLLRVLGFALVALGLLYGIGVAIRTHIVEAFKIPGGSMAPALFPGDHIVVDKTAVGSSAPLPARGEVIVFEYPDPDPDHPRVDYLKRVVGVGGDRVVVQGGHPIINGWRVPSCLVGTFPLPGAELPDEGELHVEFLGKHSYLTWYQADSGTDEEGPYKVPPGQVFVLGDNRWNSSDSRSWNYGRGASLPAENIKGRALSVWLSFDQGAIAWDRIGLTLGAPPRVPGAPTEMREGIARCLANPRAETLPPQ